MSDRAAVRRENVLAAIVFANLVLVQQHPRSRRRVLAMETCKPWNQRPFFISFTQLTPQISTRGAGELTTAVKIAVPKLE
jgi:hypothetical protein